MSRVLAAFSPDEEAAVSRSLAYLARVLRFLGGNVEEVYWSKIYREAKQLSTLTVWSNLAFNDLIFQGCGVELKSLKRLNPFADQGRALMHPAGTRKISFDENLAPEHCKDIVLSQWAAEIAAFEARVRQTSNSNEADLRWGILLWAGDFSRFLYFEEALETPDPRNFRAEWGTGQARGKPTRNLYIFDKATGAKRYSVTLPKNGAKLQPYFDIPTQNQGAYLFEIEGTEMVPLWIRPDTYARLGAATARDHDALIVGLLDELARNQTASHRPGETK